MPLISVSEALSEFVTLDQWLAKKQAFVLQHLSGEAALRDRFASQGGTTAVLARERQSIHEIEERKILLRRLIQRANEATEITFENVTRSIADWLAWKREVLTRHVQHLEQVRLLLTAHRGQQKITVHLDERELLAELEKWSSFETWLTGQLSLRNATMTVDVPADTWRTGIETQLTEVASPTGSHNSPATTGLVDVVLMNLTAHTNKIAVIKTVRELLNCGLLEAKTLVESLPKPLQVGLSMNEAQELQRKLLESGAIVHLFVHR
jgi:ribosomal protein L7/L12